MTATAADAATKKKPAPVPEKPKASYELPMTVAIVRSDAPGCEPLCPEWIAAEGEITTATPALFRKALKAAGKKKLPVIINSPGGQMNAALEIGRMIRKAKLDVAVGWTLYGGCKPTDKACKLPKEQKGIYRGTVFSGRGFCNSACPLVLASGIQRLSGIWTYVGVHQVRTTWYRERVTYREKYRIVNGKKKVIDRKIVSRKPFKSYQKDGIDKRLRKSLTAYFTEMGVSLEVIEDMNRAPFTSIYQLSVARQEELKLVTSRNDPTSLTSPSGCRMVMAPANCIQGPALKPEPAKTAALPAAIANAASGQTSVQKASDPQMLIATVRSSLPGCEPQCPEWIAAQGPITVKTPELFKELLDKLGPLKLPVVLSSSGGDFDAALDLGKLIRGRGLDVILAKTQFDDCWPGKPGCLGWYPHMPVRGTISAGNTCNGACLLVLGGGSRRYAVASTDAFLFHPAVYMPVAQWQAGLTDIFRYLREMGVEFSFVEMLNDIQRGKYRKVQMEDLKRTKLVTEVVSFGDLDVPKVCSKSKSLLACVKW